MPGLQRVCFGPYRLEGPEGQLWRHAQAVHLPPKALAVLWCLTSQAGQMVSKATLLDTVWADTVVGEGVLAVCIRDLRQALGDDARQPRYIETVHRRGYRFVASVERCAVPPAGSVIALPERAPARLPVGLVGREDEVAQVHAVLECARRGQRQVLFVAGEAGIGKTTLLEACLATLERPDADWVAWGQCVEAYGPGTGYLPILEALGRLCRGPTGATVLAHLRQWAPTWLAQLTGVLPPDDLARLHRQTQGATRERRMRELAEALEALAATQLLLLVLEDLHWSDASTVDVVAMLARRREAVCLVVLGTYRPVELILRTHPLRQAVAEMQLHGQCAELALGYLPPQAVEAYVAHRFPGRVAATIAPVLYQRTAGHPLFMVHLTEYLAQQVGLDSGAGEALATQVAAAVDVIPVGVQQLIGLQLGRLHGDEQRVLEMASVAGVEFAVASVAAGLHMPEEQIETVCAGLLQRGPFLEAGGLAAWPDGTLSGQYRFRHALYQQVLYRRLTEAQRMQGHRCIGMQLEAGYGEQAGEQAAQLAVHFTQGRDHSRAVHYHKLAAHEALRRWAYQEGMHHLREGMVGLAALPETPERAQQELDYQIALGQALTAIKGHGDPDVERTYARARTLCHQVGDPLSAFKVLQGLQLSYLLRGEMQTARELAEQLLILAQRRPDPICPLVAYAALGMTLNYLGEFIAARMYLEQGITLSGPEQQRTMTHRYGVAHGVLCRAYASQTLWYLGYPDQALRVAQQACTLAQELASPHSLAYAHYHTARLLHLRGEVLAAHEQAETFTTIAREQGFAQFLAQGAFLQGWMLAAQGQSEVGLQQMHQGLTKALATGAELIRPFYLALLAEVHGKVGHSNEGLRLLDEALAAVDKGGQHYCEAEMYRVKGEVLLRQTVLHATHAEACFHQALAIARHQQARSWELRAATSLSRLWQQRGKRDVAHALLADVYGWFTEGFDTADLQEAKALLQALGSDRPPRSMPS